MADEKPPKKRRATYDDLVAVPAFLDRTVKLPIYGEAGVDHAWLVDPDERSLEVLRRDRERWKHVATHVGDIAVRAAAFEAAAIDLSLVWKTRVELAAPR